MLIISHIRFKMQSVTFLFKKNHLSREDFKNQSLNTLCTQNNNLGEALSGTIAQEMSVQHHYLPFICNFMCETQMSIGRQK